MDNGFFDIGSRRNPAVSQWWNERIAYRVNRWHRLFGRKRDGDTRGHGDGQSSIALRFDCGSGMVNGNLSRNDDGEPDAVFVGDEHCRGIGYGK